MKELHLNLPEKWSDLAEEQVEYVANLLLQEVKETDILTICFLHFSGLKVITKDPIKINDDLCYQYSHGKEKHYISVDVEAEIISQLEWLVKRVELFKNPAKINGYYGCNYKLYGITLEEFLIADQMYMAYSTTKKEEFLNKLMAICYRCKSDAWNEGVELSRWMKRFTHLPMINKYVVYLWFTGVKSWIISEYPNIFNSPGGTSASPKDSIMSVLAVLSGGDVSKNAIIKRSEVHEALDMLNRKCDNT